MPYVTLLPERQSFELVPGAPLTDLEFASDETIVEFGCRVGSCGACVVEIVECAASPERGNDDERSFLEELGFAPDRHRLACQTRVQADITIRVPER